MDTYTTSEVADLIGVHPNTVRLYEELNLIPNLSVIPMVIVSLMIFI